MSYRGNAGVDESGSNASSEPPTKVEAGDFSQASGTLRDRIRNLARLDSIGRLEQANLGESGDWQIDIARYIRGRVEGLGGSLHQGAGEEFASSKPTLSLGSSNAKFGRKLSAIAQVDGNAMLGSNVSKAGGRVVRELTPSRVEEKDHLLHVPKLGYELNTPEMPESSATSMSVDEAACSSAIRLRGPTPVANGASVASLHELSCGLRENVNDQLASWLTRGPTNGVRIAKGYGSADERKQSGDVPKLELLSLLSRFKSIAGRGGSVASECHTANDWTDALNITDDGVLVRVESMLQRLAEVQDRDIKDRQLSSKAVCPPRPKTRMDA